MAFVEANGITLAYEESGPADAPVLLMIHGLGAQLVRWPQALCDALVAAGFRIIRYDSRDIGLSTKMEGAPIPDLAAVTAAKAQGRAIDLPYTLSDLAADAAGLLDALGVVHAHVLGVSLGGMVAQLLAIEHTAKVRSMTIMMSQSGNPAMPGSNPAALAMLSRIPPDPVADRAGYLQHQVDLNRILGSPAYPASEADLRAFAGAAADRCYYPQGPARQLAASRAAPDRRAALGQLQVPTLVIHGKDDVLIPPVCGRDIADAVPGAWFLAIGGMGHDLPAELTGLFVANIAANCARAERRA